MFGSDPLDELAIPDGTHVQEHDLVTDGDVLVGGQSTVELGVRGGNVVAGERVRFGGDIEADGDCRLDMWCDVDGNVLVGQDAYLGERVHITGRLMVSGDLDIGDDVDIERGFEASGWIVIRNPMPTIVFLFVYLSQLLRIGEEEAAEEVAAEFLTSDREADPLVVPRGARVSDDAWRVSTPARIGDDCRVHGNIRAERIEVGTDTEVFGSLRARGDIRVGSGTIVHGDVTTKNGDVAVAPGAHVRGDISCENCELSEAAEVDGAIRARGTTNFTDSVEAADESGDDTDGEGIEIETENRNGGPTSAFVRLGEGELTPEPTPAVRRVSESDFGWDSGTGSESDNENERDSGEDSRSENDDDLDWKDGGETDPSRNGAGEELGGIIAEAEDA